MDKSKNKMYNETKEKTYPTVGVNSTAQGWLDKNKDSLKYAGDGAKKSINAGLDEAHSFMKDADEGTSFGKVQDAAVKWRLASDANDKRLANTARNEMIGHLSSENKETYLKNAQPLRAYIDAKDEYDYRQRAYTTTENVDKTPREAVRQTQRMLNEAGYTDKFGEPLKEDGILAGKTQYALDKLKENAEKEERADEKSIRLQRSLNQLGYTGKDDNPLKEDGIVGENTQYALEGFAKERIAPKTVSESYPFEYPLYYPERDAPRMLTDEEFERRYGSRDEQFVAVSSIGEWGDSAKDWWSGKSNELSLAEQGSLSSEDEQKEYSETKKKLIKCISGVWYKNGNTVEQGKIHNQAERLRRFDDENIEKAYLLNNSDGAFTAGHNAVMLVDKNGNGVIFSVASSGANFFSSYAELRFSSLGKEKVNKFVSNNGNVTNIFDMPATDGAIQDEEYDNLKMFEVSHEDGMKMFEFAVNRYDSPGKYKLLGENCNHFAIDCLNQASNININADDILPNKTFENII